MVAPKNMSMMMNMVGLMYAPTSRVTLMAMAPLISKQMEHRTRTGVDFTTKTDGIGDVKVTALVGLTEWDEQNLHLNLGISAPTGAVDETGDTPMGTGVKLPYPMQLGSGTWDLLPGLTYLGQAGNWGWGAQGVAVIRMGENDQGYALGNALQSSAWGARRLAKSISLSGRVVGTGWRNIEGEDADLNPMMVPTADPSLRRGYRWDAALGANYLATGGYFKGHRLAVEFMLPFYQDLEGPQLETDWSIIAGWQYAWSP
jgi:hypothetical protein